jgi:hypothetical protein
MRFVIAGIAAVIAGVACVLAISGVVGIACGAVVAALVYVGVGMLLKPETRLGGVVASMLPHGEEAAARIEDARTLEVELDRLAREVHDSEVRTEIAELKGDIENLAAFTEKQPSSYRRLAHFMNVYGEQCMPMLRGYLTMEGAGTGTAATCAQARSDAIEGLNALEGAAQGELKRAMGGKATELSASSDAIRRLTELDGYQTDARTAGAAGKGGTRAAGDAGGSRATRRRSDKEGK